MNVSSVDKSIGPRSVLDFATLKRVLCAGNMFPFVNPN
jgi:hypothetical protein